MTKEVNTYIYAVGTLRIILYPFSLLYGLVVGVRNLLFDSGILRSESYPIPIISVGNLTVGGTGKTPHVEYLIRLLKSKYRIATLSRGYGRKTKGFLLVERDHTSWDVGDEALQYRTKFPEVIVAVDENRRHGIRQLMSLSPPPDVILMDDAFQHRYVKPGLSILLTDYYDLYTKDHLLPAGRLREYRSGARRAQIIIVTKTEKVFSPILERELKVEIGARSWQSIYYSYIKYETPVSLSGEKMDLCNKTYRTALLVTGIANPYTLEMYMKDHFNEITCMRFSDHHVYSLRDVFAIRNAYEDLLGKGKVIMTTEKDAMRFKEAPIIEQLKDLPMYYIPIRIEFHTNSKQLFNTAIHQYVERS